MDNETYPRNLTEDFYYDDRGPTLAINGYNFYLTCMACPEQYDIFHNGKQVAYARLRGGRFSIECPDVSGEQVFRYVFDDGWKGSFADWERYSYLEASTLAISEWIQKNSLESPVDS